MKRVYVWEFPVRLTHWLNFLSIITLCVTGYYIADPFMHAMDEKAFIMAQMRFFHFVAAYVFTASVLVRIYWWFVGNRYARLNQFIPAGSDRRKNILEVMKFYAFVRNAPPEYAGHTGIAGLTYFVLFMLFLVMILTGFALYSESHVGGLWKLLGGWLLGVMSSGTIRLIHHGIMWIIIPFVVLHLYIAWQFDRFERSGVLSSIFTGYKTMEE